ncbi:MAG TPA: exodeoxyribonuclease VII large subunit [Saprospiraceae bacterium]|nr:exodeoxyribonuclease VII large subunit [Saprospiraceae bacterium]
MSSLRLSKLNEYIRRAIAVNFQEPVWITAEIASVKESRGHWYLELAEKEDEDIVAQASAVLWRLNFLNLYKHFPSELELLLKAGNDIRIQVFVEYHVRFGLKLVINNIDPKFTYGQIAQKRAATIQKLIDQHLWQRNKETELAVAIKNIAVISSKSAAGKSDFHDHLMQNDYQYSFNVEYFYAAMQGQNTEDEVCSCLEKIIKQSWKYELVVIIRGGGAKLDLIDFDSYRISAKIALVPIPVIVGIGHSTDESVADLNAFQSVKTPTAAAEFIVNHNLNFETDMLGILQEIKDASNDLFFAEIQNIHELEMRILALARQQFILQQQWLDQYTQTIYLRLHNLIQIQELELRNLENHIESRNPFAILKTGYTMVIQKGKWIKRLKDLSSGEAFDIKFEDDSLSVKTN